MRRNRPSSVAFAHRTRSAAFTLIELLVVIAILALLMAAIQGLLVVTACS